MGDRHEAILRSWVTIPDGAPWHWHESGDALVLASGTTIALRDEIVHLVEALASGDLPPLGALALMLAASRDSWSVEGPAVCARLTAICEPLYRDQPDLLRQLRVVERWLATIHALPRERRATTTAKLSLSLTLRDRAGNSLAIAGQSAVVKAAFSAGIPATVLSAHSDIPLTTSIIQALACLAENLEDVRTEVQRLVELTGLEEVPEPAAISPNAVRTLMAGLADDDELGGLAALTKHVLAAVSLPRPIADHQDLQVGGVSDLSNRGSLDRLVIGELANDDLILAIRVASGEALYLHREAPPQTPMSTRAILIDVGIRMWGLPRVFATAVALALAAAAPGQTKIRAWSPRDTTLERVDLATRSGLIDHLATLQPHSHPGGCLRAWKDALSPDCNAEVVLITHDQVVNDPSFVAALYASGLSSFYIATVDSQGQYRLLSFSASGHRIVQEATIDLNLLFRGTPGRIITLRRPDIDEPLIYGLTPFPLRLYHQVTPRRAVMASAGRVLTAPNDGRLMLWEAGAKTARQLTDQIPIGALAWMGTHDEIAYVIINKRRLRCWVLIRVALDGSTSSLTSLGFADEQPVHFERQGNALLVVYPKFAVVHQLADGTSICKKVFPEHYELRQTRFLVSPVGWHALSFDGQSLDLIEVVKAGKKDPREHYSFAFFDRVNTSGPWGMIPDGSFIDMGEGEEVTVPLPKGSYRFIRASNDGNRVLVANARGHITLINLEAKVAKLLRQPEAGELPGQMTAIVNVAKTSNHQSALVPYEIRRLIQSRDSEFSSIRAIARCDGCLTVLTFRRTVWLLSHDGNGFLWVKKDDPKDMTASQVVFTPLSSEADRRQLKSARSGASEYLVDSRGLLHCRTKPANLRPEITIAFGQGYISIWSSSGCRNGHIDAFVGSFAPQKDDVADQIAAYAGDLP